MSLLGASAGGGLSTANGGSSVKGGFKSIGGRASGGYVAPGQTVRVNEQRGGAEYLRMGSQGAPSFRSGQVNQQAARGENRAAASPLSV